MEKYLMEVELQSYYQGAYNLIDTSMYVSMHV